jgi:hypothetical protein
LSFSSQGDRCDCRFLAIGAAKRWIAWGCG